MLANKAAAATGDKLATANKAVLAKELSNRRDQPLQGGKTPKTDGPPTTMDGVEVTEEDDKAAAEKAEAEAAAAAQLAAIAAAGGGPVLTPEDLSLIHI